MTTNTKPVSHLQEVPFTKPTARRMKPIDIDLDDEPKEQKSKDEYESFSFDTPLDQTNGNVKQIKAVKKTEKEDKDGHKKVTWKLEPKVAKKDRFLFNQKKAVQAIEKENAKIIVCWDPFYANEFDPTDFTAVSPMLPGEWQPQYTEILKNASEIIFLQIGRQQVRRFALQFPSNTKMKIVSFGDHAELMHTISIEGYFDDLIERTEYFEIDTTTDLEEPLPLNDSGNAHRVAHYCKNEIRYVQNTGGDEGSFYCYKDGVWQRDETLVIQKVREVLENKLPAEAKLFQTDEEASEFERHMKKSPSASYIRNATFLLRGQPGIQIKSDQLDSSASKGLLNCNNGLLDLQTRELLPHDHTKLITRKCPTNYNPEAKCPRWLQFLDEVFQDDKELIEYIQFLFGYFITGENNLGYLVFFHGKGGNGKGTLIQAINETIGTGIFGYAYPVKPDNFYQSTYSSKSSPSPDLVNLIGKRFISSSEGEPNQVLDSSILKRLTSANEPFPVRGMYAKSPILIPPVPGLIFSVNERIPVKDTTRGFWRRTNEIPFKRQFDIKDPTLGEILKNEREGILLWLVDGAQRYYEEGKKEMTPPLVVKEASKKYQQITDSLDAFYSGGYESTKGVEITFTEFKNDYLEYCEERSLVPFSAQKIGDYLKDDKKHPIVERGGRRRVIVNLRRLLPNEIEKRNEAEEIASSYDPSDPDDML